jgi:GPH family glycoside/pentoside/hexuronide:cation symporter
MAEAVQAARGRRPVDIGRSKVWIYGSLSLPLAMVSYPLAIWVPRLYASDIGLQLALIGAVISAAAIFDAVTDPAMGFLSDRLRTRWGRRKPWILLGTPMFGFAVWMLLNPHEGATIAYLALWFMLLRLGSTLLGLPYAAWGAELSAEYHTRTMIQSAREKYVLVGLIGGSAIPLVVEWSAAINESVDFIATKFGWLALLGENLYRNIGDALIAFSAWTGITSAAPKIVLGNYSIALLVLLPVAGLLVLAFVPEVPPLPAKNQVSLLKSLKLMFRNGLFRRIIIIELLIAGGENFRNVLSLFFMQDYIGVKFAGEMYVVYFGVGLFAISFWDWLAHRFGKHRSLGCAMVLVGIVSIWIFTLDYGDVGAFYILFALKGFCFGAFAYLPRAMMADVVDIDTGRSGDARPGSYFAILGIMTKMAGSFGGLALPMLALVGYTALAGPEVQNGPTEILWLGILYAIVPTVMFGAALSLCWTWPLTDARHRRIQGMLERRNARLRARAEDAAAARQWSGPPEEDAAAGN